MKKRISLTNILILCAITFANCNEVIIETGQEESVNNQEGADNNNTEEFPENTFPVSEKIKTIPLPPTGQRWIVNDMFTDDFNASELDESKWINPHPTWKGREPGLFEEERVSFKDGCMVLEGIKMNNPIVVNGTEFNISCAAVVSKEEKAHYGYYECRFKANKTTLSSTFWLSNRSGKFPTDGKQPEGAAPGMFKQELDICECIGRTGDFNGNFFYKGMNSNVHYWFTPEGENVQKDIRAKETRLYREDGGVPSDDFNVYGCWWKDKSSATFYLNNTQSGSVEFYNRDTNDPFYFTEPMGVNMVVETYPYPWIELPSDEELADETMNKTYYDWVRAYTLIDINVETEESPNKVFGNNINITNKENRILKNKENKYSTELIYTADYNCNAVVIIYNKDKKEICRNSRKLFAGYASFNLEYSVEYEKDKVYYIVAYLLPENETDINKAYQTDSYILKTL